MNFQEEIVQENALGNETLRKKVESLSTEDLNTPMEAGWTVSAVLAHLAFWDFRAVTLIDKWKKEGVGDSPMDTDVINEVTRRLFLSIPPEKAAQLVLSAANEIDRVIEALDPEMIEAIRTTGKTVRLNRADHRITHLGEIENALKIV
jgi:hypothetical protein